MVALGEIVSLSGGILLIIISAMVIKAYWRRVAHRNGCDTFWLALAIVFGFASLIINAIWWQVVVNIAVLFGKVDELNIRDYGLLLDFLLKSLSGISGILHLVALHRGLPIERRRKYRWYDMPWYPRRAIERKGK